MEGTGQGAVPLPPPWCPYGDGRSVLLGCETHRGEASRTPSRHTVGAGPLCAVTSTQPTSGRHVVSSAQKDSPLASVLVRRPGLGTLSVPCVGGRELIETPILGPSLAPLRLCLHGALVCSQSPGHSVPSSCLGTAVPADPRSRRLHGGQVSRAEVPPEPPAARLEKGLSVGPGGQSHLPQGAVMAPPPRDTHQPEGRPQQPALLPPAAPSTSPPPAHANPQEGTAPA